MSATDQVRLPLLGDKIHLHYPGLPCDLAFVVKDPFANGDRVVFLAVHYPSHISYSRFTASDAVRQTWVGLNDDYWHFPADCTRSLPTQGALHDGLQEVG